MKIRNAINAVVIAGLLAVGCTDIKSALSSMGSSSSGNALTSNDTAGSNGSSTSNDAMTKLLGDKAGHYFNGGMDALRALALSPEDEDTIGQSVGVGLTNQFGVDSDEALRQYVSFVGLTLAEVSSHPDGNYVFGVLNTPEVNAFSGSNGYIFITKGALLRMHDEAELAGVLAHEITHVLNRDGLNQVKMDKVQGAVVEVAAASVNAKDAKLSKASDLVLDAVVKGGYSQPQEFAADEGAVRLMSAAGYDPNSYLRFLQRLQQDQVKGMPKLMSTHPDVADRITHVTAAIQTVKPGAAILADRYHRMVPTAS